MAKHVPRTCYTRTTHEVCGHKPHFRLYSTSPSKSQACANGPLTGVKILDMSRVLAAPFCTQILADYGADVIKVEDVAKGDDTRHWKVKGEDAQWKPGSGPMSNYFASVNRNKRSICLNLKHEQGREAFIRLAKDADVVVENMRPGVTEKLGIDYKTISKVNPAIIYASVSGYGPSGPMAKRAGYDMIAGAEAGLLHLTGERNGPPVRPGLGLTDMCTGLFTHGAIIAALHARTLTGRGQKIDASLFESQIALLTNVASTWLNMGQEAERWGTQHPSVVPYDAFKSKDLYFVVGATNDKQFRALCMLLGLSDLPDDPRFNTNADRVEHRDELFPLLNKAFAEKTTDEWVQVFEGSGMPYAPINTMAKVFSHPQTDARNMVQQIPLDAAKSGTISILGSAVKFSDTQPTIRRQPPLLGEHSKEILREVGYSEETIADFAKQAVI
ncbi:CoA-transferase family III domain-containing protein [Exophiala viscosa]|uniref:CoA-transferase family III domain-containing protein n=1 Tax=Exophiala viscosa TaxID=2486360 RepID=UPI0021978636|nr:CoA-transferase family III domain-containing protein [Exophiala viscosa]